MRDFYLFYQNMTPYFDGSDAERNSNLVKAMQVISGKLKKGEVIAAGFSDILLQDRSSLHIALWRMAFTLDVELRVPNLFATYASGTPEYTAISVNKKFNVKERGRVMRVKQENGDSLWKCVPDDEIGIESVRRIDNSKGSTTFVNYFESGSRGLAYVCGEFGDRKMVIGFTHRMSAEGREKTYQLLTDSMKMIWDKHPDYEGEPTIFGGDFAFAPGPMNAPYSAIYPDTPGKSTANPSDWQPVPTSDYEGFDFWVANHEIPDTYASYYEETHGLMKLSRHCGIALWLHTKVQFEEVNK